MEEADPALNLRSDDFERGAYLSRVWVSSLVPGPSESIQRVCWEKEGTGTPAPCPAHSRCSAM